MAAKGGTKSGKTRRALKSDSKRVKAFKASGGLKRKLEDRRKHKKQQTAIQNREALKKRKQSGKGKERALPDFDEDGEDGLGGDLLGDDGVAGPSPGELNSSDEDESSGAGDEDILASLDEAEDEAVAHKMDLEKLAQQDPEFYKYLAENDRELLEFDADELEALSDYEEELDEDGPSTSTKPQIKVLRGSTVSAWARAMLEHRSLKSLRNLLLAFRSVAFADDAEQKDSREILRYSVQDPAVFEKVVKTALKYTPLVATHHVPVKEGAKGKIKVPTQAKQYGVVQRLVKSFFASWNRLSGQLSDADTIQLAINESARLVPYILIDRKTVRVYLKVLLDFWSNGDDSVRVAAFLAIRKVAVSSAGTYTESILKSVYLALIQASRKTTAFTLPIINLLKNSASELYLLQSDVSYQLAFGYIRQLAIHLRNSMKHATKDAFKAVYNWQVVHSIDFWSLVLATACDRQRELEHGEHPLKPLIYPLVEVALGIARLVPNPRYFPLRFQLSRSLLRISQRTGTLIPIAPLLIDLLDSAELKRKPKPSSQLKPLDFEYYIRAPAPYQRTKTYADGLAEELVFLLAEAYATQAMSVAFPEFAFPGVYSIRRHAKRTSSPKLGGLLKSLAEKLDAQRNWIEARRAKVSFAPVQQNEVATFLAGEDVGKTPLGMHLRRERKVREQKREMLEKAAQGDQSEDESS